jgi:hypothetical protein
MAMREVVVMTVVVIGPNQQFGIVEDGKAYCTACEKAGNNGYPRSLDARVRVRVAVADEKRWWCSQ